MKYPCSACGVAALCVVSAQARAQASPTAWSPQSNASGCNDGKGCHNAVVASALIGAVPAVTVGIEWTAGSSVRPGLALRIVLMTLGAASLATGAWDGYAYRADGPGSYLPGPIVGGILGAGSIIANLVIVATPPASGVAQWSPSAVWMSDVSGRATIGPGVSGLLY